MGVMKSIGEAVRLYGIDIVTIGIVPSEYKHYWNDLDLKKVSKGTKKKKGRRKFLHMIIKSQSATFYYNSHRSRNSCAVG